MDALDSVAARDFAVDTVKQLRRAGFTALFAGGCVRDERLGLTPKDFDVATDARPETVQRVFQRGRTLALGAAFGVIERIGSRRTGHVQIATFRSDLTYSDGRRPDAVVYSTPEEDARRRDFTINGLFLDPLTDEVFDFVGGLADLDAGIVRAIGDPQARLAEDKLRMLRGPRFASRFGFTLEAATADAIRANVTGLTQVSSERIADEMRRMLASPTRGAAVRMLAELGLWEQVIVPEAHPGDSDAVERTLRALEHLATKGLASSEPRSDSGEPTFPIILAAVLRAGAGWGHPDRSPPDRTGIKRHRRLADDQAARWKLANQERDDAAYGLLAEMAFRAASIWPWPDVQPLVADARVDQALDLTAALLDAMASETGVSAAVVEGRAGWSVVRQRRAWPPERLDPPPLLAGADLARLGVPPGPLMGRLLAELRREQLDERITQTAAAEAWVRARVGLASS